MKYGRFILLLLPIAIAIFFLFWKLDQVDIEGSEDIYISDAVGYLRNDPFMTPRYHLRKPHEPASPHPFLVPLLLTEIFKFLGLSIASARFLPAAFVVMTTVIVIVVADKLFHSPLLSFFAGLIFATLPLTIRYGRMVVLDPFLALFEALTMLWLWLMLNTSGKHRFIYSLFCGVGLGLVVSTKLTGIFFVPLVGLFISVAFIQKPRSSLTISALVLFSTFVLIFFLFNDPSSYIFALTHFQGRGSANVTFLNILKGLTTWRYWLLFAWSLVGILPSLLLVNAPRVIWKFRKAYPQQLRFLILWVGWLIAIQFINPAHVTGLSSEWAFLPLAVPLSIVLSMAITKTLEKVKIPGIFFSASLFYFLSMVVPVLWYGLRVRHFPLPNHQGRRNVLYGDLAITNIVQQLNSDPQESLVLVILKGVTLPLWLLKDNLKTEPFYHPITEYNYIVTDNAEIIEKAKTAGFDLVTIQKNPSEIGVYLFGKVK